MSSLAESLKMNWFWVALFGCALFFAAALSRPNLLRARFPASHTGSDQAFEMYSGKTGFRSLALPVPATIRLGEEEPKASHSPSLSATSDRKIVRTGSLAVVVKDPAEAAEKIRAIAEGLGGYVENAQISGTKDSPSASITVRVPASRFEEAKAEIRKLAAHHIEAEKTDARDMTKEYIDRQAHIRNLRAEEAQYLAIMKSAAKVPDMLEVSEKLSEVRGQIEQEQAEFETLSKQVETVALSIALRAEAQAQVFGLHWRPLYEIKMAAQDALDGLTNYATTMLAIILYIPLVLLWTATIILGAAGGWKLLRWIAQVFFAYPKSAAVAEPAK
jgi:hypothetical protein